MRVGILTQWSEHDDNLLRGLFYKYSNDFKAGKHGATHARIKDDLKKRGIDRTEKAVARRMYRLGLKFYTVKRGEVLCKCAECGKAFVTFQKYINRDLNPKLLCNACVKKHRYDWEKKHRAEHLQYLRDYDKLNRAKRRQQQIVRRMK